MSTHIIVGVSRGIGLQLAQQLHARGERVVAVCRTPNDALAPFARTISGVDVTQPAAVQTLAEALREEQIDTLWLVAGLLQSSSLATPDFEACQRMFEVNSLGPLRVVAALRDQLGAGTKVALVTSRMGSMGDNSSGGSYGYRMSKAALNAAGVSMAVDLKPAGVAVALLHPGWVRTDMTSGRGLVDADESAAGLIARTDALTLESSGGFWHMNGETLRW